MKTNNGNGAAQQGQKGKGTAKYVAATLGGGVIAALAFSGGTLALWNDSVETEAYEIQAGSMEIGQTFEGLVITDATPGGLAEGKVRDNDNLQVKPGDVLEVQQSFDIALDGTDLFASVDTQQLEQSLNVVTDITTPAGPEGEPGEPLVSVNDVTFTDTEGNALSTEGNKYYFSSNDTTMDYEGATGTPVAGVAGTTLDDTAEIVVTYTVEFAEQATNLDGAGEVLASLESVDLTLNQAATW